jgi:aminoglycoside 6'-N-acetyltransferase
MSESPTVSLRPMQPADLDLVAGWLADPEVARWYLTGSTIADEIEELMGCVSGADPTTALIVLLEGEPVGWCQWYLCSAYPEHADGVGAGPGDVGIDYAIGDRTRRGHGLGTALIVELVAQVRRSHPGSAIFADPQASNLGSRRVLEKNGFRLVAERPLPSEPTDAPMAVYHLAASRRL